MQNLNRESAFKSFEVIDGGRQARGRRATADSSECPLDTRRNDDLEIGRDEHFGQRDAGATINQSAYEERIEERFRQLSGDIQHFVSSLQAACLADHTPAREILDELAAKQGKLAWSIGVARRSEGPARKRLWPDIERMVGELESTLRLLSRLQFVEGHWRVPAGSRDSSYSDVS